MRHWDFTREVRMLGDRINRFAACGYERCRGGTSVERIDRVERLADSGHPVRGVPDAPILCVLPIIRVSMYLQDDRLPFGDHFRVVGDLLGPRVLPRLPPGWKAWEGGRIRRAAEEIYEGRDWGCCLVVADMLLDAGVQDEELLRHLRSKQPHYLGCWAMDFLTGRLTRPRRKSLLRLPELERPVVYEVLADTVANPADRQLLAVGNPQAVVRDVPRRLARTGRGPLERRPTPRLAYHYGCAMFWHQDAILSIRGDEHVLEREVLL